MTHPGLTRPLLFEPGDCMSREEFLDRWERMPEVKFAELIDGIVYMPSPLSYDHGLHDSLMHIVLGTYAARSGICRTIHNATWLMLDSAPQPDIALLRRPGFGGTTTFTPTRLPKGVPELVVEMAKSSRSYDLGPKLALYQRAGVPEYVTVVVEREEVQWRVLDEGSYRLMKPGPDGVYRSRVFPGLWVGMQALREADDRRLLEILEQGLATPEFQSFIDSLRRR